MFEYFFLIIQTLFVFFKPQIFVTGYLLYGSSFLGFSSSAILFSGNDIGLFYQNVLMLVVSMFSYRNIQSLPKKYKYLMMGLLGLFLYGIIAPVMYYSSSVVYSIVASKEFSSFFLLFFLLLKRNELSYRFVIQIISFLAYYYLFILLVFGITGYTPPFYVKRPGEILLTQQMIISLFLFVKAGTARYVNEQFWVLLLLAVWAFGMYYEGHSAILMTTLIGVILVLFRTPFLILLKNFRSFFVCLLVLMGLVTLSPIQNRIADIGSSASFDSRSRYNEGRYQKISERPLMGHGFIHKKVFKISDDNIYAESLSFIDSGYVDLLGKFGIIGTAILLMSLAIATFSFSTTNQFLLSIRVFLVQYYAVNITWAVLSFTIGIVALSLAMYLTIEAKNECC